VEYDVHRRATIALATAQVWSGHKLCFLVSFLEGEGVANHERLVEDFDEAVDAITAEVPVEEVILEAL
jgi:succinylarginine dihydrolase